MIVFYCKDCNDIVYYNEAIVDDNYEERFLCPKCGCELVQTSDY